MSNLTFPLTVLRQNNTTDAREGGLDILTGWGFIPGNASSDINEAVSFGVTFADEPIIVISYAGSSTGTDYTSLTANRRHWCSSSTQSTTGFTAEIGTTGTLASGTNYFYTWIAIGQLS